jgi:hypothetical protein
MNPILPIQHLSDQKLFQAEYGIPLIKLVDTVSGTTGTCHFSKEFSANTEHQLTNGEKSINIKKENSACSCCFEQLLVNSKALGVKSL